MHNMIVHVMVSREKFIAQVADWAKEHGHEFYIAPLEQDARAVADHITVTLPADDHLLEFEDWLGQNNFRYEEENA